MRLLTFETQLPIIVSIRKGQEVRCPLCGKLFAEGMVGGMVYVTCHNSKRHPSGLSQKINFQSA